MKTDRFAQLKQTLGKLPKDRSDEPVVTTSYFSADEWALIHKTYEDGTSLRTIYDALPDPKNKSYNAFKEAFRKYRRHKRLAAGAPS